MGSSRRHATRPDKPRRQQRLRGIVPVICAAYAPRYRLTSPIRHIEISHLTIGDMIILSFWSTRRVRAKWCRRSSVHRVACHARRCGKLDLDVDWHAMFWEMRNKLFLNDYIEEEMSKTTPRGQKWKHTYVEHGGGGGGGYVVGCCGTVYLLLLLTS
jgi:hypothetical protein